MNQKLLEGTWSTEKTGIKEMYSHGDNIFTIIIILLFIIN